jgi:dolichol-phosphate mannosyltransferase
MKCIVVLPTYNEAPNIAKILEAVFANGPEWHALVVDDNSPDGTGKIVDDLAADEQRISILHRTGKLGLGTAYRDGLSKALTLNADYICTMDSDFSHDPTQLPRLRALAEEHGSAHGSRYVKGGGTENWGLLRKLNSLLANSLTRIAFGVKLRDCTSGFRCYRREIMERLQPQTLTSRGYAVLEELLYRCSRLKVTPAEHPILFKDRIAGDSKISIKESFAGLALLFKLKLSGWKPE